MLSTPRLFLLFATFAAGTAVALGAFAAHGLKTRLDTHMLEVWQTGVHYQMFHALALLLVALWAWQQPGRLLNVAGGLFILGTVLFSGSLYTLALTGIRWLGAITPLGGLCFLVGWLLLFIAAWRGAR